MTHNLNPDISVAVETLRSGGLILYPTDTVWGIGCDATNSDAVTKVFKIKRRIDSKALITLVDSVDTLSRYVPAAPEVALELASLTTTPLTIIYDNVVGVARNLLADDGSAAIRIPLDNFCIDLCRAFRKPIVSTSANISGCPTPRCFAEIQKEIIDGVNYVCQSGRNNPARKPSGIIKISNDGSFRIIR